MLDAGSIRMPTAAEILAGLTAIAHRAPAIAIAWHIVLAAAVVALAAGWRPAQRLARAVLALPLASVAVVAFAFGNPFNGVMFAVATIALALLAVHGGTAAVSRGGAVTSIAGLAAIAYGWIYPHFVDGHPLTYLYAAPVGLVPCPTLAIAIGFALLGGGLGARLWSLVLAAFGLFYGLFGVMKLGVQLDVGLVLGAAALAVVAMQSNAIANASGVVRSPDMGNHLGSRR